MPVLSIVLCVSLSHSLLLTLLSLILFSSLIAQQSTTPNQGHFKGIERRRKWKEEDEEEGERKRTAREGKERKEISNTHNTQHIHTYIERERERKGINESPTKSSRTHGLDYWWALAKLPDATPGARARSEVEVVY